VEKSFVPAGGTRVSIYVRRGEAVGLLGPNGAERPRILHDHRLIKADRGAIELDGHDVTAADVSARPIGSAICRRKLRSSASHGEQNIRAVLEVVEPNKKSARPSSFAARRVQHHATAQNASIALSGGERRRVEIGGPLRPPNYMLLDEPFAGIDPIAW